MIVIIYQYLQGHHLEIVLNRILSRFFWVISYSAHFLGFCQDFLDLNSSESFLIFVYAACVFINFFLLIHCILVSLQKNPTQLSFVTIYSLIFFFFFACLNTGSGELFVCYWLEAFQFFKIFPMIFLLRSLSAVFLCVLSLSALTFNVEINYHFK